MIDLHTHSLLSDGLLLPSELVRRAEVNGYKAIGITDHVDHSNIDFVVKSLLRVCKELNKRAKILVIPGVELTHVSPEMIQPLVSEAKSLGAKLILGHGESLVEPVEEGTNMAAIRAGVDILAHPGLITKEEALLASRKGVYLEITTRKGHSLSNGHVVKTANQVGASLVLNTDAHSFTDLITMESANSVAIGAGLSLEEIKELFKNSRDLVEKMR